MKSPLKVEALSHSFLRSSIFRDISFSLFESEFVLLVGKNGAGKSTLLNTISGVIRADSGRIEKKSFAFIGSSSGLYDSLSVKEHIDIFYNEIKNSVYTFLESAEKSDLLPKYVSALSKGELAHVLLAIELSKAPELVLLDEVTSNLDASSVVFWCNEMKKLSQKIKTSFLFATHDISRVAPFATKALVLEDGAISEVLLEHLHGEYVKVQR